MTVGQFKGCLLGLATGDALGAPYEGGLLERLAWRLIGTRFDGRRRWTDDTQMALDLAAVFLESGGLDSKAIAKKFASSYRWSRGYGPGAARVLKRIRRGQPWELASKAVYSEGSFGNGAAMRAPVLALFFPEDRKELLNAARKSAMVTHAHPIGIEGAVLIASAAQALLHRVGITEVIESVQVECTIPEISLRLENIAAWIRSGEEPRSVEIVRKLGNGMTAHTSCPTALYIALRYLDVPFETMMSFIIKNGGDVDTIGAMAGALWGIANGAERLPQIRLEAEAEIEAISEKIFHLTRISHQ